MTRRLLLACLSLLLFASQAGAATKAAAARAPAFTPPAATLPATSGRGARVPLSVVLPDAYAPYSFRTSDGQARGMLVDQWRAWEKATGIPVRIEASNWNEALRRMRAGEFDVIDCIVATPARRRELDFTAPYLTIEASIYFRKDIAGIADLASLKGFPVGVTTGDQRIDRLRKAGVDTVIGFRNNVEIVQAAKQRKIGVFVMSDPAALNLLERAGIAAQFHHSAPVFRDELRRAVRKGDAARLREVAAGFAAIDPRELARIDERWFGRPIAGYGRYLLPAAYAAAAAVLLIAMLVLWNRSLRRGILQRTAALGESELRLREAASQLELLSRRLVLLQELERKALARELHDRVGQNLTALSINLSILRSTLPPQASAELRARLEDSEALLEATTASIRSVVAELRPPMLDDQGLALALDWYAGEVTARTGVLVQVQAPAPEERPPPQTEIALFRIAQEALNNVVKHAWATRVEIVLAQVGAEYRMTVEDDGVGFDAAARATRRPGLGMVTMRERSQAVGGSFEVRALPGSGTLLTVRVPAA